MSERLIAGMRVAITRPEHQAEDLSEKLRAHELVSVVIPVVAIEDPADGGAALRQAMVDVEEYDWVVFTSENTVDRVTEIAGAPTVPRIAAIGSGTANALLARGWEVHLTPTSFVAESLVSAFPSADGASDGRVLLPRAEVARDVLPDGLRAKGWKVDVVDAYRSVTRPADASKIEQLADCAAITFTASSTVRAFVETYGVDKLPNVVVCIGPVTEQTANELDVPVTQVATDHTMDGVVDALVEALRRGK